MVMLTLELCGIWIRYRVSVVISYSIAATVACCSIAAWSNSTPLGRPVVPDV